MADDSNPAALTLQRQGVEAVNNIAKALANLNVSSQGVPTGGTTGQVLAKASSTNYDTVWQTISGSGTVTSVQVSGGSSGLTFSGGPVTTSGTITLSGGALAASYGGVPTGGSTGQALVKNSATNYDASWQTIGGSGTVTSVDASGGSTGLTFSGGPVTVSGTLTLGGTLVPAYGGTGLTSYTTGDILFASGTTALSKLPDVATGNALISGGVGVAPIWGKVGLTTHISGTLAVGNGGTGATTLTSNGILYGAGTSAVSATSAMTDGQLLVGQTSSAPLPKTITGDVTFSAAGGATLATNQKTGTIGIIIDGGGVAITTGVKGDLDIPFACTISEWTVLADQSGSIVVDIWKDTYANYPPTGADTITGSSRPTISAATKGQSSTLTGWTTSINANDTLRFNVDSASTIQRCTVQLKITKT